MTQNAAEIKTECACTCIIVECMCSKDGYIPAMIQLAGR